MHHIRTKRDTKHLLRQKIGTGTEGVVTKGVFSVEESLESLKPLNSLDSLENGRIHLYFPLSGGSPESQESLNSLEPLENGLFWRDPFSKKTPFSEPEKMARGTCPSRGKITIFLQAIKTPFYQTPSLSGKKGHSQGKGKLFSGEILSPRGKIFQFASEGKFANLSFRVQVLPQRCLEDTAGRSSAATCS